MARQAAHCTVSTKYEPGFAAANAMRVQWDPHQRSAESGRACNLATHEGVNIIMELCGETRNASQSSNADCRFSSRKHTGAEYWNGLPKPSKLSTAEVHEAGCTCDTGLASPSSGLPSTSMLTERLQHLASRGGLPIGGCSVKFNGSVVKAHSVFSNGSVLGKVQILPA